MIKKIILLTIPTAILGSILFFSISAYSKYKEDYIIAYQASHKISQRTLISEADLEEVLIPSQSINDDVLLNKNDILGKYVKLSYSIPKGSLFYKTSLETDIKDLANTLLLDKQVNYDLYTNEVKVNTANLLKNMYVDLYLTINTNDKPVSDLLLRNARVTGLYDNNGKQINDYDMDSKIAIISLAINSEDVSVINSALLVGEIKIIVTNNYEANILPSLNKKSILFNYL